MDQAQPAASVQPIEMAAVAACDVEARGLRCPLPALRLAAAIRAGGPGVYRLSADDPAADADIPALAHERGWRCEGGAGLWLVLVEEGRRGGT